MTNKPHFGTSHPPTRVHLRLLETTDIHATVLPFDYALDRGGQPHGLTRVATLIAAARAEVANSLLFDNGDFLQGTPLAELGVLPGSDWDSEPPVITAMNHLGYDAVNLGNHEFNYGLDPLETALGQARFPVVSTNAGRRLGATPLKDAPYVAPWLILPRRVQDEAGQMHDICVGVLGLLPPETTIWDRAHLEGRIVTRRMASAARAVLPAMRAAGADIIIALTHSGLCLDTGYAPGETLASDIAAIDGIDVVMAGHMHHAFPVPDAPRTPTMDPEAGTVHGTPTVMAGAYGSHLGVVDLVLDKGAEGWHIAGHHSHLRPTSATTTPPDPDVTALVTPAHTHLIDRAAEVVSHSSVPLCSHFWMLGRSQSMSLVARAKQTALARHLLDQGQTYVPVLATATIYAWGGLRGPASYHDIPPGPITRRHITSLYEYPNTMAAMTLTGADLRQWLERAAALYHTLDPATPDQPLTDPDMTGHNFDILTGVRYDIDLGQPALYAPNGRRIADGPGRIRNLTHNGQPIPDDQSFAVALNTYRGFGAGAYPMPATPEWIDMPAALVRDTLADYLRDHPVTRPVPPAFGLIAPAGSSAIFETGPGARTHLCALEDLDLTDLGTTPQGFARFRIRF